MFLVGPQRKPGFVMFRAASPQLSSGSVDYSWRLDERREGFNLQSDLGWVHVPAGEKPDASLHTFPTPLADAVFGQEPKRPFDWCGRRYRWEVRPRWTLCEVAAA